MCIVNKYFVWPLTTGIKGNLSTIAAEFKLKCELSVLGIWKCFGLSTFITKCGLSRITVHENFQRLPHYVDCHEEPFSWIFNVCRNTWIATKNRLPGFSTFTDICELSRRTVFMDFQRLPQYVNCHEEPFTWIFNVYRHMWIVTKNRLPGFSTFTDICELSRRTVYLDFQRLPQYVNCHVEPFTWIFNVYRHMWIVTKKRLHGFSTFAAIFRLLTLPNDLAQHLIGTRACDPLSKTRV